MPISKQAVANASVVPVYGAVAGKSGSHALGAVAGQAVHTWANPSEANKEALIGHAVSAALDPQVHQLAIFKARQAYESVSDRIAQRKAQRASRRRT